MAQQLPTNPNHRRALKGDPALQHDYSKLELPWAGNPRAVQVLSDLVRKYKPLLVFLIETGCDRRKLESIKRKMGFDCIFTIEPVGRSGCLALAWKKNVKVQLLNYARSFIDVEISHDNERCWRLTGFYGEPDRNRRMESWARLRMLSTKSHLPWVCIGDFNDLLLFSEKRGGRPQPTNLLQGFRNATEDAGLFDLEMRGYQYTWSRGLNSDQRIEARLDRAMANRDWLDRFADYELHNCGPSSSTIFPLT